METTLTQQRRTKLTNWAHSNMSVCAPVCLYPTCYKREAFGCTLASADSGMVSTERDTALAPPGRRSWNPTRSWNTTAVRDGDTSPVTLSASVTRSGRLRWDMKRRTAGLLLCRLILKVFLLRASCRCRRCSRGSSSKEGSPSTPAGPRAAHNSIDLFTSFFFFFNFFFHLHFCALVGWQVRQT